MSDEYNPALNVIGHINKYYVPIFLCLSLLGNSLSVYVLLCTKLRYNLSSIYLGALAMSDIGVLVTVFVRWFRQMEIITQECWLILWLGLQYLFCFLSVWIVVTFTVQRYIVIKWPLFRRSLCTVKRAIIILTGLAGLAVLFSIPWYIVSSNFFCMRFNTKDDITNLKFWKTILSTIHTIISFVLPATMVVAFNTLIMYNIRKQNRIRRNLILSSSASNEETQRSDNEASHIAVTKMLVVISSLFICLNVPIEVVTLCSSYGIRNIYITILMEIGNYLFIINYGINFVLYCAAGRNFRRELICMFRKHSDSRREDVE
ncbi:probable G-protein coupled receptor 139 [Linepithema humile]|uniref:probable G-protein coupled receptor 139 n=1 Tax=Linepithema humile TaxID=83485 RepID=UPI0006237541|nr:PREDICTED: probable G-protein coupled receptor 139 [Linepithema humile]